MFKYKCLKQTKIQTNRIIFCLKIEIEKNNKLGNYNIAERINKPKVVYLKKEKIKFMAPRDMYKNVHDINVIIAKIIIIIIINI